MQCSRCENCQGKGKMLGLGCMLKECTSCAGVGYVSKEPVPKKRTRRPNVAKNLQEQHLDPKF